jgi:hypothetical protein
MQAVLCRLLNSVLSAFKWHLVILNLCHSLFMSGRYAEMTYFSVFTVYGHVTANTMTINVSI